MHRKQNPLTTNLRSDVGPVNRLEQSQHDIEQEARQCCVEFPGFEEVWPLVAKLIASQSDVREDASASLWETRLPGILPAKPLLKTLTPSKPVVSEHIRRVVRAFAGAAPESIPRPETLEDVIGHESDQLIQYLPQDPGKCCEQLAGAGVPRDVATLLLWAIFSPFFSRAREGILRSVDIDGWSEGSCPVCGARPHMARLRDEDGARILECWLCQAEWQFPRLKCPYCGNSDQNTLGFFYLDESSAMRVHFCKSCGSYIKVVDTRVLKRAPILSVYNLATLNYDAVALSEGFKSGSGLIWPVA